MRRLLALAAALAAGCGPGGGAETGVLPEGPAMEHEPPAGSFRAGDSVVLEVTASDPQGVAGVEVYHRVAGDEFWDHDAMEGDEAGATWTVELAGLEEPGLEYWFKGTDGDGAVAYLPAEGAGAPFALEVGVAAVALPFSEDFEPDSDEETSLYAMGWWTPSEGYTAYQFSLTDAAAHSEAHSAVHGRAGSGSGGIADWLISPALDFSGMDGVMVTWWEMGRSTDALGRHGLYVSTGSRDPADGDFVEVEPDLPAPEEGEWTRSAAYDLSAWAGEPVVYVAWRYEGAEADDWYVDDVEVRALAADLSADLSWSPDPVHPGETATVTIVLTNASAAGATGLEATLTLPEGGGTVAEPVREVGDIEPEGTASVDFEVAIDASAGDNRYLPLHLDVTDGTDTWSFDLRLLVGLPSSAEIALTLDDAAALRVEIGAGDPDDPDALVEVASEMVDAGTWTATVDVTGYADLLPPTAGDGRWFARVSATADGTLDRFAITVGGETVEAGGEAIEAGEELVARLPPPPEPVLVSMSPDEAVPGDVLPLTIVLRNDGAATQGAVTATVVSADADLTILGGGPVVLDTDAWEPGEQHVLTGVRAAVSSSHVDSTPLALEVQLADEVEGWTVEAAIDVPWPVLRVASVEIDDSGGDGVLDPGETATLTIALANAGQMDTPGPVTGTLSVEPSSTASATVTSATGSFGRLSVGSTRDADFAVEVTGGSDGDTLELLLELDDGTATYEARTTIVLGEPPWTLLSSVDDATGDALDASSIDLVNAWYRVSDGRYELLVQAADAVDLSTAFLEIWGTSSAADYTYYRWVLQSGTATMQGYTSSAGFQTIGSVDVDAPSSDTVRLAWDLDPMGLALDRLSLGLAAGWCGPPDYYCDQLPDGWGYPYVSFDPGMFIDTSW